MAKNTLSLEVEKIAKKVANEVLKNHPLMISMAQWHSAFTAENKNIRDANRILELRIIQLEKEIEFLKKQTVSNIAGGETQPPPEEPTQPDIPQEPTMLPRELKKIRGRYNFNQQKMAELLGVSNHRYNKWERGEMEIPADIAENLRAFTEMPLGELREFLHSKGIFQPNGNVARQQTKPNISQSIINAVQQSRYTAEDLKNIRIAANLSLSKIAAYLGVPSSTYSSWEYNRSHMPDKYTQKIIALQENLPPPAENSTESSTIAPVEVPQVQRRGGYPQPSPYKAKDLLRLRNKLRLSQKQLALKIGVPTNTYGTWERGACNMPDKYTEIIKNLFEAYTISPLTPPVTPEVKSERDAQETVTTDVPITRELLQRIREKAGKTQIEMAMFIGVSHSQYSKWEQGTRGISESFLPIIRKKLNAWIADPESAVEAPPTPPTPPRASLGRIYTEDLEKLRIKLQMSFNAFTSRIGVSTVSYAAWRKCNYLIPDRFLPAIKLLQQQADGQTAIPQLQEMPSTSAKVTGTSNAPRQAMSDISMEQIEEVRLRLLLPQREVAQKLGVSYTTYKLWKRENRNIPEYARTKAQRFLKTDISDVAKKSSSRLGLNIPSDISGEELKALRIKMNMTQPKMAERFGVTASTYQKWEQGASRMPEHHTATYKQLLANLSTDVEIADIEVLPPEPRPPMQGKAKDRIEVTPEMLLIINSARQQLNVSEEKMSQLLEMDVTAYKQLESGEKNSIRRDQWRRLEFLLNLPEDRREAFINPSSIIEKDKNE
ncbi:MAG: helix-turn-helix domain-containing protein [Lentisphaeria bacterium]|nr:helix-turn-helix domain-containing protein [Lentisphaeria bacterium]